MARRSQRRMVEELLDRFEPHVRSAFLAAFDDIVAGVEIERLIEALRRGDLDAAMRALHLEPAAFRRLERVVADAYIAGGDQLVRQMPPMRGVDGMRVGLRFDPGDPAAANWINRHVIQLSTRITEDQHAMLRRVLSQGLLEGTNPRQMAVDIAGRYDPRVGHRVGGLIGLTDGQAKAAERALAELRSGVPGEMAQYLNRAARDRSFDRYVKQAIADERPLDAELAGRAIARYRDGLLKMRADTIARNETAVAVNHARNDAMRQMVTEAGFDAQQVVRTWHAHHDERTRAIHRTMDGQEVEGFDAPFVDGDGNLLMYPGDPNAPLETTIQCRCVVTMRIRRRGEV